MNPSVPRSGRMRWLRNLGVYLGVVGAFVLSLGLAAAVSQGLTNPAGAIAALIVATLWLGTVGLFALVPYLVVVELLLRQGRHRRLLAVALGAAIPSAGLVLSQMGHPMSVTSQSILVVVGVALPGAIFGAVAQLPPIKPSRVTLANAEGGH